MKVKGEKESKEGHWAAADKKIQLAKSETPVETNVSYSKTYSVIPLLDVSAQAPGTIAYVDPLQKKLNKKNSIVRNSYWKYLEMFMPLTNIRTVQDKHLKDSI